VEIQKAMLAASNVSNQKSELNEKKYSLRKVDIRVKTANSLIHKEHLFNNGT
jgi:hypothetical protein